MEKKYRALRFVSGFYKVVGIIIGVITVISALGICLTSILSSSIIINELQNSGLPVAAGGFGVIGGIISALISLIFGALAALGMYAIGELITLLINMEENTRVTAALLHSHNPAPAQPQPQLQVPPQQ